MELWRHILVSNAIMLLVPLLALKIGLFSNQIYALRETEAQNNFESINFEANTNSLDQIDKMSDLSQFILSRKYLYKIDAQFDGIHFLTNKYRYQPNFAFIKGYTTVVQGVKFLVEKLNENFAHIFEKIPLTSLEVQIIFLVLINKIFFALSVFVLYSIALYLTEDTKQSLTVAKIFIYNPAGIFFHAVYTESIYTFLTFSVILCFIQSQSKFNAKYLKGLFCLCLGVFFRTNGIFLAPIFGIPIIFKLWIRITNKSWSKTILSIFKGVIVLGIILTPLIWYQHFAYSKMCSSSVDLKHDQKLKEECGKFLPNLYNFVQVKYWSVGFLSYWKLSNVIFILIGLPAIIFSLESIRSLIKSFELCIDRLNLQNTKVKTKEQVKLGLELSFVILLLITVFLTNIQSSTRFLSSHVVFYLILSENLKHKLVRLWIFLYYTFGGVLFCIGFPWT